MRPSAIATAALGSVLLATAGAQAAGPTWTPAADGMQVMAVPAKLACVSSVKVGARYSAASKKAGVDSVLAIRNHGSALQIAGSSGEHRAKLALPSCGHTYTVDYVAKLGKRGSAGRKVLKHYTIVVAAKAAAPAPPPAYTPPGY